MPLKKPTQSDQIRALLAKAEPTLLEAFEISMDGVKNSVNESAIIAALKKGDVEGAANLINVEPPAFRPLGKSAETVYETGGEFAAKKIPKVTVNNNSAAIFRFDVGSPSVAEDLKNYSYHLVENISQDQKNLIRKHLSEGIAKGQAPRRTALELVGRINPITKRREGGVIGLTDLYREYVGNMSDRLRSGDPEELKKILQMSRRDRRYDAKIKAAIATGKPIPADDIKKMTGRYADRLLQLRGETIARTETMRAFNRGQIASMQQAIDQGRVNANVVVKVWHAFLDERTRFTHINLNKKKVGFYDKFKTLRGNELDYPGDDDAPGAETINCRCHVSIEIDFFADLD